MKTCAVLVWDREATAAEHRIVTRPCGARTTYVVTFHGDALFAACSRHNARLRRALPALTWPA
jgi:predicted nucleic acid-binding Zn ribbon protein